MTGPLAARRIVAAALAALVVGLGAAGFAQAQQVMKATPIGGHLRVQRPHRAAPHPRPRRRHARPAPPQRAPAASFPFALPIVPAGAPIPGQASPASVFRPAVFRAIFRVPHTDARLYVVTRLSTIDLEVTVVGPKVRRTLVGTSALPGRILGVALPADAWQADAIGVTATTISAHGPPYLVTAETLASLASHGSWYAGTFGAFAGFALVLGALAYLRRSRLLAYAAAFAAAEALLRVPFLGVVRLSPLLSQPFDALADAGVVVALMLFAREYLGAALPRGLAAVLWTLVGVNIAAAFAADLLQDWAIVVDVDTTGALGAIVILLLLLAFVVSGFVALRARIAGAAFYLAATAAALVGWTVFLFGGEGSPLALGQPESLLGDTCEAALFTIGLLTTLGTPAQAAAGPSGVLDGITGLATRTAFDAALERAWKAAGRMHASLALVLIDLDHFRRFNDRYGPAAGDRALRAIAALLRLTTRDERAYLARYRDATLAALLERSDLAHADGIAKRAMSAIAAEGIEHEGVPANRLTVSIGVAAVRADDESTATDLRKRAENALYVAKAMGRNRIVLDEPLGSPLHASSEVEPVNAIAREGSARRS